ncbi:hypothetical protein ACROYT_G041590 [Oculina patagonica]
MADGLSVVVCATVSTGLESVAVKECKERLGCKSVREGRGRIYFDIPANSFSEVKSLRSIEHLFVVVKEFQEDNNEELNCYSPDILEKLYKLPQDLEWNCALSLWKEFTGYSGILLKGGNPGVNNAPDDKTQAIDEDNRSSLQNDNDDESLADSDKEAPAKRMRHSNGDKEASSKEDSTAKVVSSHSVDKALLSDKAAENESPPTLPRFRVTCSRTGNNHSFSSPEAAAKFGGGINDWFGWRVDLSHPDIEVLLNIVNNSVVIGIALTKETRGKRNIAHFGPTTLKSSIAYSMLSLANIQPGDIVCDPMCGGGSIPIEGALNWPTSVHLCGDHHDLAPPRTLANVQNVQLDSKKTLPLDIYQWDVCKLPLKSDSVDVFISDLPFGKKSGSKHENWKLYPKALEEMARVCRTGSGRAVLLTQDKRVMGQVLNRSGQWKKDVTLWINMGGLKAGIYVLTRTKQ